MYDVYRQSRIEYWKESKRTDDILSILKKLAQPTSPDVESIPRRPSSKISRPNSVINPRSARLETGSEVGEEVEKPEVEKPEVEKPEAEKPEVEKPEVEKPEVEKPEVEKPEARGEEERENTIEDDRPTPLPRRRTRTNLINTPQPEEGENTDNDAGLPNPNPSNRLNPGVGRINTNRITGLVDPLPPNWEEEEYDSDPEEPEPTDERNRESPIPDRPLPDGNEEDPDSGEPTPDVAGGAAEQPDPELSPLSRPTHPPVAAVREEEQLRVLKLGTLVFVNSKDHKTDAYEISHPRNDLPPQLIVRRGQGFDLKLSINRLFNAKTDHLRLKFTIGENPEIGKGTIQHVDVEESPRETGGDNEPHRQWKCEIKTNKEGLMLVVVTPDAKSIVGKWNIAVETWKKRNDTNNNENKVSVYKFKQPLYVLFNPMNPDDDVYMENEDERDEYVFNDTGKIYRGSSTNIHWKSWFYGQFEEQILDCCLHLLDTSSLKVHARGDVAMVCRAISAVVNAPNEGGVLTGNWTGDYAGGTSPLAWVGSVKILEEYFANKVPVKFGQCWVFSGVTTTVCRALGIPTRSISNFSSAHDTDGSMTIDKHFDADLDRIKPLDMDSIWNFHVWNEAWIKRPDLEGEYSKSGWNAFDATPQELSNGIYQAGPCPVKAVKDGDVIIPHDGKFIFAEVNADIVSWQKDENNDWKTIKRETSHVGKQISTKLPRKLPKPELEPRYWREDPERLDITDQYKHPEGSEEERKAVDHAGLHSHKPDAFVIEGDVKIELQQHDGQAFLGDNIDVNVTVENTSQEKRNLKGFLVLTSVYTTGVVHKEIKKEGFEVSLDAGTTDTVTLTVSVDEYMEGLVDDLIFNASAAFKVNETEQKDVQIISLRIRTPDPKMTLPEKVSKGEKFKAEISFTNPLPISLKNCEWVVDGPNFVERPKIKQDDIAANESITKIVEMTPKHKGPVIVYIALSTDKAEFETYGYTRAS